MITLKHIAQEFELDPYKLRKKLRLNLKHSSNQRWKWDPKDPELAEAKKIAKLMKDKIDAKTNKS